MAVDGLTRVMLVSLNDGWSLVEILRLKFARDFEAEVWEGVWISPKNDDIIHEQPSMFCVSHSDFYSVTTSVSLSAPPGGAYMHTQQA